MSGQALGRHPILGRLAVSLLMLAGTLQAAEPSCQERVLPVAAKWFGKAAEQGDSEAQFRLGLLHEHGKGVRRYATQALCAFHCCHGL